jgi:hypothetical protein
MDEKIQVQDLGFQDTTGYEPHSNQQKKHKLEKISRKKAQTE